ncbi:Phosphoinositide phosphatase SAC8 [Zea mays]|jgi:hypothetical protein|uniref:Phosphoinositide phosphatase SAC8 n=1 Tax=Zea mays TaxID=4577 RepID=A0A1D6PCW4_MAIZE|nr:Phosphoinositide phosphatase SAC8 [Zea mays]
MLIFSYVIKNIIINKNKILHNFFIHYLLPKTKKVKKYSYPNSIRNLYLSFEKIYDKFEGYLLWIFISSRLKTRI